MFGKGVDVKGMMLNTIGDHTKEMSIKFCQTKPEFYTESKTREKSDGMRKGRGVIKREDKVDEGGLTVLQFHRESRLVVFCVLMCDGVSFH
jgi:hypothetical protein